MDHLEVILGSFGLLLGQVGAIWDTFRTTWGHLGLFGTIWRSFGGHFWLIWRSFEVIWGHLEPLWGHFEAISGNSLSFFDN